MEEMEQYIIIKTFVMAVALLGAFGIFFARVKHLYAVMMAVDGKSEFRFNQIGRRIRIFFTDVLGQSNVRRKKMIGLAHTMIFFGFIAVQPHSLELMLKGAIPVFEMPEWSFGIYGAYLFIADILAVFVLVGFAYAIFRRIMIQPSYLTMGKDANLIILFTCVIIISFQFINAFQTLLPAAPGAFEYSRAVFPVSSLLVGWFNLASLTPGQVFFGFEAFYWIHMATILGFLVYIPGSKHLHLLAAAPNVFLKRLERPKAIFKTDIEDENAETFGLGKVSELNWKNVLNLYACTECGRCQEQCPAANTHKPLSPKEIIHDFKVDLLDQAQAVLAKDHEAVKPIMREGSPVTSDVLWSCTTCRACEDICPVNIEHLDLIIETRKHQVLMEASFPPEVQETFTNLENQANPWGFAADTRADWCQDLDVPLMCDNPEADLLWFVGCAGSFDDRGKKISRAMARVLKTAGVNFAILGPEEACNGDMARRAGNEYLAQMLIQQNVEVLNQYKPRQILAGCPHCFNILNVEYPQFGANYKVWHHADYLLELHKNGRLVPKPGKNFGRVTFHDSCYLGRWNGIYESPRTLISSMNQGRAITEMGRNRSKGFCCGAGGGRMFMEETIGTRINHDRTDEAIATGADTVAAACPFCITMLNDGMVDKGGKAEVKDIAEIIDEAINGE
jgi:Fe-S oxidoreductase